MSCGVPEVLPQGDVAIRSVTSTSSALVLNSGVRAIDCYILLYGGSLLEAVVSALSVEVINVVYHRQYYLSANHKPEGNWNCKERKPIQANSGEDWKAVSKRKTI